MTLDGASQLSRERAGVPGGVERHVVDLDALPAQPLGEVTHGGEDEDELLLVMADTRGLVPYLGHQYDVTGRVDVSEGA